MHDKVFYINKGLTRRQTLGLAGALVLSPGLSAFAEEMIGKVLEAQGAVSKVQNNVETRIKTGAPLSNNDLLSTGDRSFASVVLGSDTKITMGSNTEVLLDSFLAEQGGTLELVSGDMVFDRPEGTPKIDLTIRTTFGQIGVRGTKFFTGRSRGNFAVFVEHGLVEVRSGATIRKVASGEGVDIASDAKTRSLFGAEVSETKKWGKGRIEEAYKSVGLM
ncbi:FecR domain-containing protein [Rhizobium sp. KVB221]|uniref:FecR domain-containing protein n=1 Tax=Rhizobium setariae TaxID=2801340 RepID=A0A936YTS7_9HYPH|nr:FecR family protein [Rhizobium setariae]MBL0372672.1 FecR domain-containing protein [Rhizobium setariae]